MTENPLDPLAALSALYLKGLAAFQSTTGAPGTGSATPPGTPPIAMLPGPLSPAISAALTDGWRISAASALRYGQALLAVQMRYQARMFQSISERTRDQTEENLVLADEVRAFLREIGETAEREARRLQIELGQIAEALAAATAQTASPANPAKRAYRVKR
jgi:hypothetical protein